MGIGLFGAGEWLRGKRIGPRMNTNLYEFSLDFIYYIGLANSGEIAVALRLFCLSCLVPLQLALALLAQGSLCCGAGQGAGVFAAETGLVTVEEMEDLGFVGEGAEGAGEGGDWGLAVIDGSSVLSQRGFASASFFDVFRLFDAPEAHATPLGYGHDFGLVVFDLGCGLEFDFERG